MSRKKQIDGLANALKYDHPVYTYGNNPIIPRKVSFFDGKFYFYFNQYNRIMARLLYWTEVNAQKTIDIQCCEKCKPLMYYEDMEKLCRECCASWLNNIRANQMKISSEAEHILRGRKEVYGNSYIFRTQSGLSIQTFITFEGRISADGLINLMELDMDPDMKPCIGFIFDQLKYHIFLAANLDIITDIKPLIFIPFIKSHFF